MEKSNTFVLKSPFQTNIGSLSRVTCFLWLFHVPRHFAGTNENILFVIKTLKTRDNYRQCQPLPNTTNFEQIFIITAGLVMIRF